MNDPTPLSGLYVITDPGLTPPDVVVERCAQALAGGARIIQLRDKLGDWNDRLTQARALTRLSDDHGALFLVNDDARLAALSEAHGVHIGRDDGALETARALLGDTAVIGVSCYNELDRALHAEQCGASYVAFGRFFPSNTKPAAVQAPIELLELAHTRLSIPIAAIGGITAANARPLIRAGAHMLAVIEGVFGAPDPEHAARRIVAQFRDTP